MNKEDIVTIMKTYVSDYTSHKSAEDFESVRVADLLESSFDAVNFTMKLEEKLGLEEGVLDIETWAPKFADITFGRMAEELEQVFFKTDMKNINS